MNKSIEEQIAEAVTAKLSAILAPTLEGMRNEIRQLSQREEKPMNLKQACSFLQITVPTFNKYRHLVTDYGLPGTPRFLASELLKIRDSLKRNKAA